MKARLMMIIVITFLLEGGIFAQGSFQNFTKQGFRVKCGCILYENTVFIQAARQQGVNNILAAYICAENKDSPDNGVIVNINIYDESGGYNNIKPSNYEFFEKRCLHQYAANLSNAGFQYNNTTYQGVPALEYNFDQQGLPTKALMFFKNKKSYLLQVATRNNLTSKFNALKTSFEIL